MVKRRAAPNPEAMMIAVRFAGGRRVDGEEEGEDGEGDEGEEEVFMVFFFFFFSFFFSFYFYFLFYFLFYFFESLRERYLLLVLLLRFFSVMEGFLFSFLFKNWGGVFVVWLVGWQRFFLFLVTLEIGVVF